MITKHVSGLALVGAAILIDDKKRLLFAERPAGKSWAGYLEFPGGKINEGESPRAGLARELKEELGITVAPADLQPLTFLEHSYSQEWNILLLSYICKTWSGKIHGMEGQNLHWFTLSEIVGHKILPADEPILQVLQVWDF